MDPEAVKNEWLGRLEGLVRDVEGWAEAAGWRTRRINKTVDERRLGKYEVPVLLMEKDAVEGDRWVVHYCESPKPSTTSGMVETTSRPYDEATLRAILDGMAASA